MVKRVFDVCISAILLAALWPVIAVAWVIASIDTGASGFFRQIRIGRNAEPFTIVKIRTMRAVGGTAVTTRNDARITAAGHWLRRFKIDELPQLWNILKGDMSLVGPRPDVPGYLDKLTGEDRILLTLRPGITGPATLKYRNEEDLLASVDDPEQYNDTVIWPDKVRINVAYIRNYSLRQDLHYLLATFGLVPHGVQ